MTNGNARAQQALAARLAADSYEADDIVNLARNIYVRALLRVHALAGRNLSAKTIALSVTAQVLRQQVGFYFTAEEVRKLMEDEEDGEGEGAAQPPPAKTAKPAGAR